MDQAADLIRTAWLPHLLSAGSRGDSPPEDFLALALRCALAEEIASGGLDLTRHVVQLNAASSWSPYEVDLLIHQSGTGARLLIEVDSYEFHRRDRWEHTFETRRLRTLQGTTMRLMSFTGAEAGHHPWKCAFEVVSALLSGWPEFAPLSIPQPVLRALRALANTSLPPDGPAPSGVSPLRVVEPTTDLGAGPLVAAARSGLTAVEAPHPRPSSSPPLATPIDLREVERRVLALPVQRYASGTAAQAYRGLYARGDETWTREETEWLRAVCASGVRDLAVLSRVFGRHPQNVERRVLFLGYRAENCVGALASLSRATGLGREVRDA